MIKVVPIRKYRVVEQRVFDNGHKKGLSYVMKTNLPYKKAVVYLEKTLQTRRMSDKYWVFGYWYSQDCQIKQILFYEKETHIASHVRVEQVE